MRYRDLIRLVKKSGACDSMVRMFDRYKTFSEAKKSHYLIYGITWCLGCGTEEYGRDVEKWSSIIDEKHGAGTFKVRETLRDEVVKLIRIDKDLQKKIKRSRARYGKLACAMYSRLDERERSIAMCVTQVTGD